MTAVTLIELILAGNPTDNQGVRYLLGSEALKAGKHDRAQAAFEMEADRYLPYCYKLALSHMLRNNWVAAATTFRHVFASNLHLAEILNENLRPAPRAIWHGTDL